MSTKPAPRRVEWRPGDPPGYRLAFAVVDLVRDDRWSPVLKLAFLALVVMAGLAALAAVLGPWSLVTTGLGGVGGTAIARTLHRRRK
jgi:hypothetical protein